MANSRLGVALNLNNLALSQYAGFDFNSMAVFNGVPLGASSDGIFSLFDKDDDNTTDIDAIVEFVTTDFGIPNKKRPRRAYIGFEASGVMTFKIKADDGDFKVYRITPDKGGQLEHRLRLSLGTKQKGAYWLIRLENVEGCDFSIDSVDMLFILLGLER